MLDMYSKTLKYFVGGPERILKSPMSSESPEGKYQSLQQLRNTVEKDLKMERTKGNGRDFALTLMPLYALGVGVFALYKFLKVMLTFSSVMAK